MRALLIALVACYAVSGCVHAPVRIEAPAAAAPPDWEDRPSGIAVGPLDAAQPFSAAWFPRDAARIDAFERADASGTTLAERRITPASPDRATLEIKDIASGETLVQTHLVLAEDGSWRIERSRASGIESTFDPPALFLPAAATPGEPIAEPFEVRSSGRGIPNNPGAGTATVTAVGAQSVQTPAGPIDAYALDIELRFAIGPAKMRFDQRVWVDAGPTRLGVVASEQHDTVRVFGITFLNARTVSVLSEPGAAHD
ncbi:MAG: hypothetical protein RIB60_04610 [Phycisphaerales bacterium]